MNRCREFFLLELVISLRIMLWLSFSTTPLQYMKYERKLIRVAFLGASIERSSESWQTFLMIEATLNEVSFSLFFRISEISSNA